MFPVTRSQLPRLLDLDLDFVVVAFGTHIVVVVERNHDFIIPKNFVLSSVYFGV
jgi:hypothetical protein